MKNRSISILMVSLCLLGLMSIMLIVFVDNSRDEFKENITVSADGVTEKTLTVQELRLIPTEKKEYEVSLTCAASGSFDIILDYEETQNGAMKSFVDVVVKYNEQVVYDGRLSELLDTDKVIEFQGELYAAEPLVVTICYEMPYDVGNEAQGTYADFDIHLKIEKINA